VLKQYNVNNNLNLFLVGRMISTHFFLITKSKLMKNIILIIVAFSALSCNEILFVNPQPLNENILNSFPKVLQGVYIDVKHKDTITISKRKIVFKTKDSSFYLNEELSKNLILKKLNNITIINYKRGDFWQVLIFDKVDKDIYVVKSLNIEANKKNKEVLAKITNLKSTDSLILINPTAKEFDKIIKKELFIELLRIRKIQ